MALRKITDADLAGKGITPLAPRPGLGAKELQKRFDQLSKDVVAVIFNQNVTEQETINIVVPVAMSTATRGVNDAATAQAVANTAHIDAVKALSKAESAVVVSENAEKVSSDANKKAEQALYAVTGGAALVTSPPTGIYGTAQQALNDLYDMMRVGGITADEYAACQLTADGYASYSMTADEYSIQAKKILL